MANAKQENLLDKQNIQVASKHAKLMFFSSSVDISQVLGGQESTRY